MAARKKGRPLRLTPEVRSALVNAAKKGLSHRDCAIEAGIGRNTLLRYLVSGETAGKKHDRGRRLTKREADFWDFWCEFTKAELVLKKAAVRILATGLSTSKMDERTALELLGRRWPDEWGKRAMLQNAPADKVKRAPLALDVSPKSASEGELLAELERRGIPSDFFTDEG